MIHYSPLLPYEIYNEYFSEVILTIEMNDSFVQCYKDVEGNVTIHRLMSTNPNDYLMETYQPGRKISIKMV